MSWVLINGTWLYFVQISCWSTFEVLCYLSSVLLLRRTLSITGSVGLGEIATEEFTCFHLYWPSSDKELDVVVDFMATVILYYGD